METRTLPTPPRVEGRKVTGYAARFNSPSEVLAEGGKVFRELILPGAFARSLAAPPRGDVLALWNHGTDGRPPLGRTGARTLRLWEDAEGLAFELDLPASAEDVRESLDRGDVRGMSFGFGRAADRWFRRDGQQWRELVEVPLFEVSPVTRPAYPATSAELRDLSRVEVPDSAAGGLLLARARLGLAART